MVMQVVFIKLFEEKYTNNSAAIIFPIVEGEIFIRTLAIILQLNPVMLIFIR